MCGLGKDGVYLCRSVYRYARESSWGDMLPLTEDGIHLHPDKTAVNVETEP